MKLWPLYFDSSFFSFGTTKGPYLPSSLRNRLGDILQLLQSVVCLYLFDIKRTLEFSFFYLHLHLAAARSDSCFRPASNVHVCVCLSICGLSPNVLFFFCSLGNLQLLLSEKKSAKHFFNLPKNSYFQFCFFWHFKIFNAILNTQNCFSPQIFFHPGSTAAVGETRHDTILPSIAWSRPGFNLNTLFVQLPLPLQIWPA